jgi:hypothetical protein
MSTLKVDSIENSGSTVNFTTNVQVGNGFVKREYTSSATAPEGANNGALWWNTDNGVLNIYLDGTWYSVDTTPPPQPFLGGRGVFGGGISGALQLRVTPQTLGT